MSLRQLAEIARTRVQHDEIRHTRIVNAATGELLRELTLDHQPQNNKNG